MGYNGDVLRAWRQSSSGRTYFLYDGADPVCELNAGGSVVATNTFGPFDLISPRSAGAGTSEMSNATLQPSGCSVALLISLWPEH